VPYVNTTSLCILSISTTL